MILNSDNIKSSNFNLNQAFQIVTGEKFNILTKDKSQ
jgi:hypothetical protein